MSSVRVIIAGSRRVWPTKERLGRAVEASGFHVTELVCGCAPGVDAVGQTWAESAGIPVRHFPAEWEKHGKHAGPLRNAAMAEYADALIALPCPRSRGTWDMVRKARAWGLPVHVEHLDPPRAGEGEG